MVEFNEPTQATMDMVLEEVCAELPNGRGHESRKFIAEQLIRCARSEQCARSGRTTLGELGERGGACHVIGSSCARGTLTLFLHSSSGNLRE